MDEPAMLEGLQACNYSAMGALAFTVYDYILSFGDEVEYIWKRPWTNLKYMYIMLRSLSFLAQLISEVVAIRLATGAPVVGCKELVLFQGITSHFVMMGVQILLILRVQALHHGSRRLRRLLLVMFFAETAIMATVFAFSIPEIKYGPHCVIIYFPVKAIGFLIPPIVFEFFLFSLTMSKFYQARLDGLGHVSLLNQFMRDGIWAFALPCICLVINTCCMVFVEGALSSIAYSWVIAIPGFAGCRLILNMSHLLKVNRYGVSEFSDQMFDTIPMLSDSDSLYLVPS